MTFKISIRRKAQKQLAKLPLKDYKNVKQAILNLPRDPRPPGSKKLKGRDGWRIRQGDYRIIYEMTNWSSSSSISGIEKTYTDSES